MDMRQQQSQHNGEKNDLGAKQEAVKQINQRCAEADYRATNGGKQQHAARRRKRPAQPLVEAGGQQFARAANVGCG